ncbi:MAG TPA: PadR family transcriptional regulator [Dongiaceae bacterium]|nr:PadR family transcriptional regulator [Dongiaceae bacterium]
MDPRTLCLGALLLGDASGYEIKKLFEEGVFSHIYEASFGAIYPALTRLLQDGLAECTEMAQDKRPDKKVYSITEKGRQALAAALTRPPAHDRVRSDFLFILVVGHLLPAAHLRRLVDERIAWYRAAVASMEVCDLSGRPPGGRLVHGLGLAVYRAAADYLERNAHLLDEGEAALSAAQ